MPGTNNSAKLGIACRVKYLVDTPENFWGCLDESMFMDSSARYIGAKHVHNNLNFMNNSAFGGENHVDNIAGTSNNYKALSKFLLLQHQWQIVESFKAQNSQRSRDSLLDQTLLLELKINDFADSLSAVAIIDALDPKQILTLFLDS
ncbi:hypothetical protein ACH5RR_003271 [Cinchona calisaya]|uniref:Conserved oligomeric Golgi complex subunit 1 n=1 Tax=Cinchona calisaya TaxID=153742 RepID=A0ABD3AUE4_9GENT